MELKKNLPQAVSPNGFVRRVETKQNDKPPHDTNDAPPHPHRKLCGEREPKPAHLCYLWHATKRVAKNSQWGASLGVQGLSPQPPEANGSLGAKAPAHETFAFFCKNNLILGQF